MSPRRPTSKLMHKVCHACSCSHYKTARWREAQRLDAPKTKMHAFNDSNYTVHVNHPYWVRRQVIMCAMSLWTCLACSRLVRPYLANLTYKSARRGHGHTK